MNTLNEYKKRFYNLMESTMGNVKPLISEDDTKGFCLKKWKDTTLPKYKTCMFEGVTPQTFSNYVDSNGIDGHIYPKYGQSTEYRYGKPAYFNDSLGKKVSMIESKIFDIGGVPKFPDEAAVKTILDYMAEKKYIKKDYNLILITTTLSELAIKNKNIAKKGTKGEIIVNMPAEPKNADGLAPITSFTFWPKAHVYYYETTTPTGFIFDDTGVIDSTFLTLIQNRK